MTHNMASGPRRTKNAGVRRHRVPTSEAQGGAVTGHSIMRVEFVAQRFLVPGSVVLAEVPFADGSGCKWRPSVVVRVVGYMVTLIPCTSSAGACAVSDVDVLDLAAAGLTKATKARTGHPVDVDRTRIAKVSGRLSNIDARRILPGS